METWIDHILTGGGIAAGLLIGIGNAGEGALLALAAIGAAWLMRARDGESSRF